MYTVAFWLVIIGFILLIIGAIIYAFIRTMDIWIWILIGVGLLIFIIGLIWWLVTASSTPHLSNHCHPINPCIKPLTHCNPCIKPLNNCVKPVNNCNPIDSCIKPVNNCNNGENVAVIESRKTVIDTTLVNGLDVNNAIPYRVNKALSVMYD